MHEFFPIIAAIVAMGTIIGYAAQLALETVDEQATLPPLYRYLPAYLGASIASVAVIGGAGHGNFIVMFGMCAFGALAGVLAVMDRETAWAPDALTIPLLTLAFTMGSLNYGTMGFLWSILAAGLVFGAAQGLWWLQDRLGQYLVPPPDLIALAVPYALFGVSFSLAIFYIVTASIILVFRQNPDFLSLVSRKEAVAAAEADLGFEGKPAITFLAVAFPVLGAILFIGSLISA